jgi:hypothetical protein
LERSYDAPGRYPVGTQTGYLLVIEKYLSLGRAEITADDIDQGGLPRTVRAHNAQYFSRFHLQVNIREGSQFAECFGYIF